MDSTNLDNAASLTQQRIRNATTQPFDYAPKPPPNRKNITATTTNRVYQEQQIRREQCRQQYNRQHEQQYASQQKLAPLPYQYEPQQQDWASIEQVQNPPLQPQQQYHPFLAQATGPLQPLQQQRPPSTIRTYPQDHRPGYDINPSSRISHLSTESNIPCDEFDPFLYQEYLETNSVNSNHENYSEIYPEQSFPYTLPTNNDSRAGQDILQSTLVQNQSRHIQQGELPRNLVHNTDSWCEERVEFDEFQNIYQLYNVAPQPQPQPQFDPQSKYMHLPDHLIKATPAPERHNYNSRQNELYDTPTRQETMPNPIPTTEGLLPRKRTGGLLTNHHFSGHESQNIDRLEAFDDSSSGYSQAFERKRGAVDMHPESFLRDSHDPLERFLTYDNSVNCEPPGQSRGLLPITAKRQRMSLNYESGDGYETGHTSTANVEYRRRMSSKMDGLHQPTKYFVDGNEVEFHSKCQRKL